MLFRSVSQSRYAVSQSRYSDVDIEKQEMAENDMDDDDEMPDDNQITETSQGIEQSGGQL